MTQPLSPSRPLSLAMQIRGLSAAELLELCGLLAGDLAAARATGGPTAAAAGEPATIDKPELARRCRILAGRAEPSASVVGQVHCPVCGRGQSQVSIVAHLARRHGPAVAAMPPERFQ